MAVWLYGSMTVLLYDCTTIWLYVCVTVWLYDYVAYFPSLHQGGGHDNDTDVLLPHHPPEVRHCVRDRALSGNVHILSPTIALHGETCVVTLHMHTCT